MKPTEARKILGLEPAACKQPVCARPDDILSRQSCLGLNPFDLVSSFRVAQTMRVDRDAHDPHGSQSSSGTGDTFIHRDHIPQGRDLHPLEITKMMHLRAMHQD